MDNEKYFKRLRLVEKASSNNGGIYIVKKPLFDAEGRWVGEWFNQGRAYSRKGLYDLVNNNGEEIAFILTQAVFEDLIAVRKKREESLGV